MLQQQLQDMAGPGAVIRIDSFEGSALPAKAQIRSIRISRDQFAAEFHSAGGVSIEIITQPGLGPIRYFTNFRVRDDALERHAARSCQLERAGAATLNFGGGMGGTLIKDKSSFNLFVFGIEFVRHAEPQRGAADRHAGRGAELRTPRDNLFVNGQMDYALTLDQTLRFGYNLSRFTNDNLGVGGYDEPERAYSNREPHPQHPRAALRAAGPPRVPAIAGAVVRRGLRVACPPPRRRRSASTTPSPAAARSWPAASTRSASTSRSDLDYVRGRHSLRAGIVARRRLVSIRRVGELPRHLHVRQPGRVSRQPSEQLHAADRRSEPVVRERAGRLLRSGRHPPEEKPDAQPGPAVRSADARRRRRQHRSALRRHVGADGAGQTTLRASTGIFYDWLPTGTYEQSLRVDGVRQQELNIFNPSFPDPGSFGVIPPINRYLLDAGYEMPRTTRVSGGVDQGFLKVNRVATTYSYQRGSRLARGSNLNAAVNGVRPDPAFRNIVQAVSDAASTQHQVIVDGNLNPGAMLPAFSGPLISWKRTTVFVNYQLTLLRNNTDGAFTIPATGDLNAEWGPAANDVRHRANIPFNNQIVRNVLVGLNVNATSGDAYTLLTGGDDNGDGIFNDRPVRRRPQHAARDRPDQRQSVPRLSARVRPAGHAASGHRRLRRRRRGDGADRGSAAAAAIACSSSSRART